MQPKTGISDAADTRRKVAQTRDRVETDATFAATVAQKIAANPSLLDGLGAIVAKLAKHAEAAAILDEVFEDGAAAQYPKTYRTYLNARFSGR